MKPEIWGYPAVHEMALDVLKGWMGVQPLLGVLICGIVAAVVWWNAKDWLAENCRRHLRARMREMARRNRT